MTNGIGVSKMVVGNFRFNEGHRYENVQRELLRLSKEAIDFDSSTKGGCHGYDRASLGATCIVLFAVVPAQASTTDAETWVSGTGNDSNTSVLCSRTSPCRILQLRCL